MRYEIRPLIGISGFAVSRSELRVQSRDKEDKYDNWLGSATTDVTDAFVITFHEQAKGQRLGALPDVYLNVCRASQLLSVSEQLLYNLSEGKSDGHDRRRRA